MKQTYIASVVLVGALLLPGIAFAATYGGGEKYSLGGSTVVEDNLYVGGGDITIGGMVNGDVCVAGAMVAIPGKVRDDLAMAGGNLSLLGPIGGDARIAGGSIVVSAPVGGDLLAVGGSIKVLDGVTVGKDLSLSGGTVSFTGNVAGDARFAAGDVLIDGTIKGNVVVEAGEKLTLGDHAQIEGSLVYRSASEDVFAKSPSAVVAGGVKYEKRVTPEPISKSSANGMVAMLGMFLIVKFVVTVLAALALLLLFRKFSTEVVTLALGSFWSSALRGFVILVMIPVSAIVLLLSVFGSLVGFLLLLGYFFLVLLGGIYGGIVFGTWLIQVFEKKSETTLKYWQVILGVFSLSVIKIIPFVGWVVPFLFFLSALGVLTRIVQTKIWDNR